ncbi:GtrA family protein [Halodesulfovibrio sp.]|uniref:GtrA family protein n=1 Tax=Halodesulfovibrio sp. TaxID=1912772 RepID=UPI0025C3AD73|nr:GtrA family protein [Halodesulfovibrio sp.]
MQLINLPPIVLFALVGGIGFIVDMAIFAVLLELAAIPPLAARILAFIGAATTTWIGNRVLTFKHRPQSPRFYQWKKFMAVASFSALPNIAVFRITMHSLPSTPLSPYAALLLGVLVGMVSNYLLSSRWVFSAK